MDRVGFEPTTSASFFLGPYSSKGALVMERKEQSCRRTPTGLQYLDVQRFRGTMLLFLREENRSLTSARIMKQTTSSPVSCFVALLQARLALLLQFFLIATKHNSTLSISISVTNLSAFFEISVACYLLLFPFFFYLLVFLSQESV